MKLVFATVLMVSLVVLISSSFLQTTMAKAEAPSGGGGGYPCGDKCAARCEAAGQQKRCLRYCGICCQKCKCVPSGTYGNKSECPCYQDMLNSKGDSKCP